MNIKQLRKELNEERCTPNTVQNWAMLLICTGGLCILGVQQYFLVIERLGHFAW